MEAFWSLTRRAWCRKSSVNAPLCLSHSRPGLVTLLKMNRLAKSCRKLLGSCTPTSSERHWSHLSSSCSKPRARQAALKVGCTTVVGVWGRWVVLRSSKHVAPQFPMSHDCFTLHPVAPLPFFGGATPFWICSTQRFQDNLGIVWSA